MNDQRFQNFDAPAQMSQFDDTLKLVTRLLQIKYFSNKILFELVEDFLSKGDFKIRMFT